MTYTTQKIGRNRTNIIDANGDLVCQLLNKEVASWLFRTERAEKDNAEFEASRRATRVTNASAYIASRATRAVQLNLF